MMRCPDVMQVLSAPIGSPDSSVYEHLATCPTCARWASDIARLDRIWQETRPIEPQDANFQSLWSQVSRSVGDGQTIGHPGLSTTVVITGLPKPVDQFLGVPLSFWNQPSRWAALVSGLAAAAALLIVFGQPLIPGKPVSPGPDPILSTRPGVFVSNFDTEPGQTLFIKISGSNVQAENRPTTDISETISVAAELDIFNFMESQSQGAL